MNKLNLLFLSVILLILASCKEEAPSGPSLPETYNFENVSYSGQTARLDMLEEINAEIRKAASGQTVDSLLLLNMFNNTSNPFSDASLNSSEKQLKNKCYDGAGTAADASYFEYLLGRLAGLSGTSSAWSPGSAGIATSADNSTSYFLDEGGVEYLQLISKGLMGAVFYYQACEVYTRPDKIGSSVDNETVTPGEGTDMEHHWDEAFGYLGAPTDYSSANHEAKIAADDARYHGKYAEVGEAVGLGTVDNVMEQFIKGRWGISNDNYDYRDDAAEQVRKEWELIIATSAIHYLNSAQANFADDALRNHALSEAYAFMLSLYYNSDKAISSTDLAAAMAYFEFTPPGSPGPVPYFVGVTVQDFTDAKNILSTAYDLDAVKDNL